MIGNGHTQPATPEQDQQAQMMLSNIEEFLMDEEVQGAMLDKLSQGEPSETIGQITGQLVHMQVVVADGVGNNISRDILLAVAAEIINLLIDMAMTAGIVQIQGDEQLEQLQGNALIAAVDAYMQLGDDDVNGEAAMQVTQQAMDGQLDSPGVQQGMINNMPSPTGPPPEGMPPQGPPPQGPPPEGMPPQQGGLL
jgi:hypothetical protein